MCSRVADSEGVGHGISGRGLLRVDEELQVPIVNSEPCDGPVAVECSAFGCVVLAAVLGKDVGISPSLHQRAEHIDVASFGCNMQRRASGFIVGIEEVWDSRREETNHINSIIGRCIVKDVATVSAHDVQVCVGSEQTV